MSNSFHEERETPEYGNLAAIADDIMIRLPGCTDEMVRRSIASVYRDFCKRSCCIKTRRTLVFAAGERKKSISPKTGDCIVDCVVSVRMSGHELSAENMWRFDNFSIVLEDRMVPVDGSVVVLDVECVEIPRLGSEIAPSWLIQRFGDAIASGVLARLMAMTGKAWSDAQQAAIEMRAYENALTETRSRSMDGGNLSAGKLNYIGKVKIL